MEIDYTFHFQEELCSVARAFGRMVGARRWVEDNRYHLQPTDVGVPIPMADEDTEDNAGVDHVMRDALRDVMPPVLIRYADWLESGVIGDYPEHGALVAMMRAAGVKQRGMLKFVKAWQLQGVQVANGPPYVCRIKDREKKRWTEAERSAARREIEERRKFLDELHGASPVVEVVPGAAPAPVGLTVWQRYSDVDTSFMDAVRAEPGYVSWADEPLDDEPVVLARVERPPDDGRRSSVASLPLITPSTGWKRVRPSRGRRELVRAVSYVRRERRNGKFDYWVANPAVGNPGPELDDVAVPCVATRWRAFVVPFVTTYAMAFTCICGSRILRMRWSDARRRIAATVPNMSNPGPRPLVALQVAILLARVAVVLREVLARRGACRRAVITLQWDDREGRVLPTPEPSTDVSSTPPTTPRRAPPQALQTPDTYVQADELEVQRDETLPGTVMAATDLAAWHAAIIDDAVARVQEQADVVFRPPARRRPQAVVVSAAAVVAVPAPLSVPAVEARVCIICAEDIVAPAAARVSCAMCRVWMHDACLANDLRHRGRNEGVGVYVRRVVPCANCRSPISSLDHRGLPAPAIIAAGPAVNAVEDFAYTPNEEAAAAVQQALSETPAQMAAAMPVNWQQAFAPQVLAEQGHEVHAGDPPSDPSDSSSSSSSDDERPNGPPRVFPTAPMPVVPTVPAAPGVPYFSRHVLDGDGPTGVAARENLSRLWVGVQVAFLAAIEPVNGVQRTESQIVLALMRQTRTLAGGFTVPPWVVSGMFERTAAQSSVMLARVVRVSRDAAVWTRVYAPRRGGGVLFNALVLAAAPAVLTVLGEEPSGRVGLLTALVEEFRRPLRQFVMRRVTAAEQRAAGHGVLSSSAIT